MMRPFDCYKRYTILIFDTKEILSIISNLDGAPKPAGLGADGDGL